MKLFTLLFRIDGKINLDINLIKNFLKAIIIQILMLTKTTFWEE